MNRSSERKLCHTKRAPDSQYFTEIVSNTYDATDLSFLADTPAHTEYMLHNLEPAARGFRLYVNSYKTEFMCFKINIAIPTVN